MLAQFTNKIRQRETRFYDGLYRTAKTARSVNIPGIRGLYVPLRTERAFRLGAWDRFRSFIYYEPMFRTYCATCGRALQLIGGIPQITGMPVRLEIGDSVEMHGRTTIAGGKTSSTPTFRVGDHTHLGYELGISIDALVDIGNHVMIASRVALMGYDFHPLDPFKRKNNEPPEPSEHDSIVIEDMVWIGSRTMVLKGVTIGRGSVIAAGSVVTQSIPPFTLAAGSPARVIRPIDTE